MRALILALAIAGCSLDEPDESQPIVLIGWPAEGANVPSGEDIRVFAAARDDGANLEYLRVEIGDTGGCFEEVVVTSNAEIVTLDRTFLCRPAGAVSVRAEAKDAAGWIGEYGPVAITVEP